MAEVTAFCFIHRFAQMKNEVPQSLAFSILTRFESLLYVIFT